MQKKKYFCRKNRHMKKFRIIVLSIWCMACSLWSSATTPFPHMQADSAILAAVEDSIIPGAVLCVVENGAISYLQAYGNRAIVPSVEGMTTNTIFDLASVSKPTGAGTAMLLLCAEGKASVDDYVSQYIPNYHADVQIRHLMTHYSGLPAYMGAARLDSIFQARGAKYDQYSDWMIDTIARCKRPSAVGEKFRYSCLDFTLLQRVVENIVGTYYEKGLGIEQSYEEAVKWYAMAAEQKNKEAMCNLGNCYRYGRGVKRSYNEAVKWYKESGTKDAQTALNEIYSKNLLHRWLKIIQFRFGSLK